MAKPGAPIPKTAEEIERIRQSAELVSRTLGEVAKALKPGITGKQLDKLAETFIRDHGAVPGFLGMYDFPATLNISINEAVIHGIPNDTPIEAGDIVSVDCGVIQNGFFGDHAYTMPVGEIDAEKQRLLDVTLDALYIGIRQAKAGNRLGTLGWAIEKHAKAHGIGVIREFCGHGLGRDLHEKPEVPNYGKRGFGKKIENGWTLAIEPMFAAGRRHIRIQNDRWTVVTQDGKPAAHFEHNIAVVDGKPVILSTFDHVEDALGLPRTTQAGLLEPAQMG